MAIKTHVPESITAGDTAKWQISLADYPASVGWSLTYTLLNTAGKITITSSASGADHLINVAAATTANYTAGVYDYTATVSDGTDRHTVATGRMEVKPDPTQQTTYDGRSQARQILESLQTAYQDYVTTNKQGHIASYSIAGRSMSFRSTAELIEQIEYWKGLVKNEEKAERIKNGMKSGNRVLVRFN